MKSNIRSYLPQAIKEAESVRPKQVRTQNLRVEETKREQIETEEDIEVSKYLKSLSESQKQELTRKALTLTTSGEERLLKEGGAIAEAIRANLLRRLVVTELKSRQKDVSRPKRCDRDAKG